MLAMSVWWSLTVGLLITALQAFGREPPRFIDSDKLLIKPEDTRIGSVLGNVSVRSEPNTNLTFTVSGSTEKGLVELGNSTGYPDSVQTVDIILKKKLDRDREPQFRFIYITVTDGPNKVTGTLRLYITDVNDEAPIFDPPSYRITIDEDLKNGSSVVQVTATDLDTGSGGRVYFGMTSHAQDADDEYQKTFKINPNTGAITLNQALDYEKRTFYQFKVRAWDTNPDENLAVNRANESDLVISVRDVQDSPPYFVNLPYLASIPENSTKGTSVLKVTAYDGDRGIPNDVVYSFTGEQNGNFSINETSGEIAIAQPLDADDPDVRNRGGVFKINVTATEVPALNVSQGGVNQTTTVVSITVLDVNDHSPTFSAHLYNASVKENTPDGVPITLETVIDVFDGDQGENSKFTISVEKDGALYLDFDTLPEINQPVFSKTNVIIRVKNSSVLDYETTPTLTFQIVAREVSTSECFNNSATVTLTVEDVNDNSPQFPTDPVHFNVSEDTANGTAIGSVNATDRDSGFYGTVFYELENDSENSVFNISRHNGSIYVTGKLDRETRAEYSLFVVAWDNENGLESSRRSGRKRIKISLLDVNDSPPKFSGTIPTTEVAEDIPINTTVLFVSATDPDLGDNGVVEYSIQQGTDLAGHFGINRSTGAIYVKEKLIDKVGFKNITVIATDKGKPPCNATQVVRLYIRDVNINPPQFVQPPVDKNSSYAQIKVYEEEDLHSTVTTLNATDKDQGKNGEVVYRLLVDNGNAWQRFHLNSSTGVLQNIQKLDREKQSHYLLQVQAEDLGIPQLISTITLNVTLLDVDDNGPLFTTRQLTLRVEEENATACVGMVNSATDADEYENHTRICYFIYGGELVNDFKLNKTSGELCLKNKLDREKQERVHLAVQALSNCSAVVSPTGSYNNSDVSMLKVYVNVDDVNDQPPIFARKDLTHGILFDTEFGQVIYDLQDKVSDADKGDNAVTYFRLIDTVPSAEIGGLPNKLPFLVGRNGSVVTNMLFSSAMLGHFVLKIQAYDIGNLTGDGELKIFIISNIQRVKIVFRGKVPNVVKELEDEFIREIEKALGYIIIVDTVTSHQKPDKTYDDQSTDMFIHARYNTSEGGIVPATELWRAFDFTPSVSFIFAKYGVSETAPVVYQASADDSTERNLVTGFVIVVIGLAILAIALGVALYLIRGKYVRRLKSYSTKAEVTTQEETAYPGTNVYACNPVYNKAISIVDVDTSSINSLDDNAVGHGKKTAVDTYCEQELTMRMFGESSNDATDMSGYSTLDAVLDRYEENETRYIKVSKLSLSNHGKDDDTDSGTFMPLDVSGLEHSDI